MCASVASCYGVCFDRHAAFSWPLLANVLSAASLHAKLYIVYTLYTFIVLDVFIQQNQVFCQDISTPFSTDRM